MSRSPTARRQRANLEKSPAAGEVAVREPSDTTKIETSPAVPVGARVQSGIDVSRNNEASRSTHGVKLQVDGFASQLPVNQLDDSFRRHLTVSRSFSQLISALDSVGELRLNWRVAPMPPEKESTVTEQAWVPE